MSFAQDAAVEAARAGEAGLGFAVVADEVRSLAQRSADAARDTAVLIADSQRSSEEGHKKVADLGTSIAAITDSVSRVKVLVDEISEASHQQSTGIDQTAHAVADMEKVTQRSSLAPRRHQQTPTFKGTAPGPTCPSRIPRQR